MHLQRQRYILFEIFYPNGILSDISDKDIIKSLWQSLIRLFGEVTAFKTGLWMVKYDNKFKYGIIRCTNITKEAVISALAYITVINGCPVIFHTIKTSGTIKKITEISRNYFQKNLKNGGG